MTSSELREHFHLLGYPSTFKVDHVTYANVCQDIFNWKITNYTEDQFVEIALGPHGGIMFKNVELILEP